MSRDPFILQGVSVPFQALGLVSCRQAVSTAPNKDREMELVVDVVDDLKKDL